MSSVNSSLPTLRYLARDASAITEELRKFVQSQRPQDINSFFEGDSAQILIEMLAFVGDILAYGQDRIGEEAILATARLRSSALRHARTFGYPVATITNASAVVVPSSFASIPTDLTQTVSANEVQILRFTATGGSPAGTFTLGVNGAYSAPITYGPSMATQIQAALESLSDIGAGNVAVTGPVAGEYTITYQNELAFTDVDEIVATTGSLTDLTVFIQTLVVGKNVSKDTVFTAGTAIVANGLTWEVAEDTTISGIGITADTYADLFAVPVVEGKSFREQFASTGQPYQKYTTNATNVAGSTLEVRVSDPDGTPWTPVDAIGLADNTQTAYAVRYDSQGRAVIEFGNDTTGVIPPNGLTVFITGRSVNGTNGNVGSGKITGRLSGQSVTSDGTTASIAIPVTNPDAASGGRDPETLDEIKRNIPQWVRTVDKAITREDIITLASTYEDTNGSVVRATAFLEDGAVLEQVDGATISAADPYTIPEGTIIDVGDGRTFRFTKDLVLQQDDPIVHFDPNVVNVYAWSLADGKFAASASPLRDTLRIYLQDRMVVTTNVFVRAGRVRQVAVDLGTVTYNTEFAQTDVRTAIMDAIAAFFISDSIQPGSALRLSDLYGVIEALPEVDHFTIVSPAADVTIDFDEIVAVSTLTFTLTPKVTSVQDGDANARAFRDDVFVD